MMGNMMQPHTKLSPTLISMVVYFNCLTDVTVVLLNLQQDAGGHFCFVFTTEVISLYFSTILWCYYTDAEAPAEIIKVL